MYLSLDLGLSVQMEGSRSIWHVSTRYTRARIVAPRFINIVYLQIYNRQNAEQIVYPADSVTAYLSTVSIVYLQDGTLLSAIASSTHWTPAS